MLKRITRQELAHILLPLPQRHVHVLEITEGETYERLHLPAAVRLEGSSEIPDWISLDHPGRDDTIVTYAEDSPGLKALEVAEVLDSLGFKDVRFYEAGKDDWLLANLPMDSDYYTES